MFEKKVIWAVSLLWIGANLRPVRAQEVFQGGQTNWPAPEVVLQESTPAEIGAAHSDSEPVGLEEYLIQAEQSNPGLKAAYHKWRGALEKVPQATSLEDPVLSFTDYLKRTMEPVEELRITQMIPYPGKLRLRGQIESAEAEALRFRDLARIRDGFFLKVSYLFRL